MATVNIDNPIISLTTDFGHGDNYVAQMKAVIAGINPNSKLIDISHNVPPFKIETARYLIESSYNYFPQGSIHIGVVDPGVGTKRKAILIETSKSYFIGPDNGLFSFLKKSDIKKTINLTNKKYFLSSISSTFHGRDIFAPVGAYLSLGVEPNEFGAKMSSIYRERGKGYRRSGGKITGSLIHLDRFGNLVSSIKANAIDSNGIVYFNGQKIGKIRKTFGSVKAGKPVAYINSSGYLEIAVNQGSAAEYFNLDISSDCQFLIAS